MRKAHRLRQRRGPVLALLGVLVLTSVALYEHRRADEAPPAAYDWQASPLLQTGGPRSFAGATSLRRWNGTWAVRGDRVFTVDPDGLAVRSPAIPGAWRVLDVGAMGGRAVALVERERLGVPHLLVQTADRSAWEEHAMPEPLTKGATGWRLSGEGEGLVLWKLGRAFFLSENVWYERMVVEAIRDVVWSEGRWLVHTLGTVGPFTGISRVLSVGPRGDDPRQDVDRIFDGSAGAPVADRRGGVWELNPPTIVPAGARLWRRAGSVASLRNGTKLLATARGVEWEFGVSRRFDSLTFDEANRPIVTIESGRGLLRLERDGTRIWLTPGWPADQRIVAALVSDRGSLVLTATGALAAMAAQPWIIRWLEPPVPSYESAPAPSWRWVPHGTSALAPRGAAFPYVPALEPTLEPLPIQDED